MHKRKLLALPAAFVALMLWAGPASAQHCFVVNRSTQGSLRAGQSGNWVSFSLAEFLAAPSGGEDGGLGMCQAQVDATLNRLEAAGLPTVFATRTDKVLLEGTAAERNGRTGDGKGIDYFGDSPVIGQIFDIAFDVLATVGCP